MNIKPHISGVKRYSRVDRPKPRSPYSVCCYTPSDKSNIKILVKKNK